MRRSRRLDVAITGQASQRILSAIDSVDINGPQDEGIIRSYTNDVARSKRTVKRVWAHRDRQPARLYPKRYLEACARGRKPPENKDGRSASPSRPDPRGQRAPDTALLYVLRNDLELNGPKYGCGLANAAPAPWLIDVSPHFLRDPDRRLRGRGITTLEGLGSRSESYRFIVQEASLPYSAQCVTVSTA